MIRRGCLIAGILALLLAVQTVWAADHYSQGKSSYQAGRYSYAIKHFQSAISQNPDDSRSRFYLGLAYARMKEYAAAKAQFQKVLEIENMKKLQGVYADQSLISKAEKNIAVMTKAEISATGNTGKAAAIVNTHAGRTDNYLTHAIPNGRVIHWDTAKMPLKVYIRPGHGVPGWQPSMNNAVMQAAGEWHRASGGKIRFQQINYENEADIVVNWRRNFSHQRVGVNAFRSTGTSIIQSDVHIATHDPSGRPMNYQEIQGTALHEFGHALGIQGHSPNTGDIMFFSQNPTQGTALTMRDKRTIQLLYQQEADITNRSQVSMSRNKELYDLLSRASKLVSTNPSQALQLLGQAERIDRSNPDLQNLLGVANYNMGVQHLNDGITAGRGNNLSLAKQHFHQAVRYFELASRSPQPPSGTQQNLAAARQNLSIVSQ